jgi:hypothetical protein
MTQADVLYVADLARKLGRTETAIRAGVSRNADWLPPRCKAGHRIAWRTVTVDKFLVEQEAAMAVAGKGSAHRRKG